MLALLVPGVGMGGGGVPVPAPIPPVPKPLAPSPPVPVLVPSVSVHSLLTPLGALWSREEALRWTNRLRKVREDERKQDQEEKKKQEDERKFRKEQDDIAITVSVLLDDLL